MKKLALFILLLHPVFIYAGGTVKIKSHKFVLVPFASAIWQRSPFGEISIGHPYDIHFVERHWWHTTMAYSKLGAEFNFNFKHELLAPKFSSEIDYRYFCLRGSLEDYIEGGKNNFYVTPEIGLTLAGFITVSGGYNKPISHSLEFIPPYRLSLSLLIPFLISGSSKRK